MLVAVNAFLQIMTIAVGTFMIERYVLLEPAMEPKKQRAFYILCFGLIAAAFVLFGDNADKLVLLLGGLNIVLGRKERRLTGFLLVVPLIGIMNGIASPVFIVPLLVGGDVEGTPAQLGILAVYLFVALLLALFYFKGKKWRAWFRENMKDRRPSAVERMLIVGIGLLVTLSMYLGSTLELKVIEEAPQALKYARGLMMIYWMTAFALTLTLVVMIVQGNRRKFYLDKLSAMQFSIIATMADIVENRDENTGGHIKRTAKYGEIIGRKLRAEGRFPKMLTEEYLTDMIVAAPLHDIGKIHIPDSILNKPAKLTDEEFERMKTHTTAGSSVLLKAKKQLGAFDYLSTAVEMAEYHHEWWNGRGYPNGIHGEEIPLCARIMAVADVFDALTAKRCYKDAMPVDKAYRIIREEAGTHFDPVIVQAFLDSKNQIEEALAGEED